MELKFLFLFLFLFANICSAKTFFDSFDVNSHAVIQLDSIKDEHLKKLFTKHAEIEDSLFTKKVLQEVRTDDGDFQLEEEFFSQNGILHFRYRVRSQNSEQSNNILWQLDYKTTSNRQFFGYLFYDGTNGILRLVSIRKDDYSYHPVVYEWKRNNLVNRKVYAVSILPIEHYCRITYFEDCGFGYFVFWKKNESNPQFDIYKLNVKDLQARLLPNKDILEVFYPFIPEELFLLCLSSKASECGFSEIDSIVINGERFSDIEVDYPLFFTDITANYRKYYELCTAYRYYLFVLAVCENKILSNKLNSVQNIKNVSDEKQKLLSRICSWGEIAGTAKQYFNNEKQRLMSAKLFYKNAFFADRFLPAGHVISENEARKFYHNYKWAFRKDFSEQSDYYSFDKVKNFIYTEMVRLESFGLKELIENPPSVSIIWKKKSPQILKHGSLDPLSPEEMERRKREFLASQPRNELFSENELKELFTEPDYTRITAPLQLARAYDWFGKYPEALAALKSAEGMAAKFELGYFLKHGRPGVSPDMEKANRLFAEIVSAIEKMGGSPSPEDYCLAGRASSEYTPENWDEKVRWKRRAASFFQKAISEGYRPAYFYSQYYLRHSSDNDPQRLLKVLPSDNLEINAFIGALAGLNSRFKSQRNRDKNLEAVKAAIYAHSNLAQAMLGMLYLHSKTDPNAFLRHNPRKAKFWLQRAADRGDTDALQILNSDSRLKDPKRSKP